MNATNHKVMEALHLEKSAKSEPCVPSSSIPPDPAPTKKPKLLDASGLVAKHC